MHEVRPSTRWRDQNLHYQFVEMNKEVTVRHPSAIWLESLGDTAVCSLFLLHVFTQILSLLGVCARHSSMGGVFFLRRFVWWW